MGKLRQRNYKTLSKSWMDYMDLNCEHCLEMQNPCVWVMNQSLLLLLERTPFLMWNGCYGTRCIKDGLILERCIAILFLFMLNIMYPVQAISSSHMTRDWFFFCGCVILGRKSDKSFEVSFRRNLTYSMYQVVSWKHGRNCVSLSTLFLFFFFFLFFIRMRPGVVEVLSQEAKISSALCVVIKPWGQLFLASHFLWTLRQIGILLVDSLYSKTFIFLHGIGIFTNNSCSWILKITHMWNASFYSHFCSFLGTVH